MVCGAQNSPSIVGLYGAAGIQNPCLIWLLAGIQRPPFEQLNPEMLSFPTRPQPPAESNSEMKSTVRRSICPKNGRGALYTAAGLPYGQYEYE
jgi:hypothetical protein